MTLGLQRLFQLDLLGFVPHIQDNSLNRKVMQEVFAPDPYPAHLTLWVQNAQAVLLGGSGVAEEVLQGGLGVEAVLGVNKGKYGNALSGVPQGIVAQDVVYVGGNVADIPFGVHNVDEFTAVFH